MTQTVLEGLFVIAAVFVLGSSAVIMIVLIPQSRKFRTDLRPGQRTGEGRFPFWQLNVLNSENYSSLEGRRFYRRLMIANYIQWSGVIAAITCLVILGSMYLREQGCQRPVLPSQPLLRFGEGSLHAGGSDWADGWGERIWVCGWGSDRGF